MVLVSVAFAEDSLWNMTMPTIESPSLGTGFYTPSPASSPYMSGTTSSFHSENARSSRSASSSSQPAQASVESVSSVASLSKSLQNSVSARDLEAMDSLGLLGGLSGILSEGYSSSLYSKTVREEDRTEETNRLLTKVLEKMEEIKENGDTSRSTAMAGGQAILVSDENTSTTAPSAPVVSTTSNNSSSKSRSRLLRFAVNGYNVLRTCRTVYISDVQDDGTFLVTGDRRYVSDGQARNETFHILFKTKQDTTLLSEYDAATAVTQDSYNPNSFVYQLSKRKNMMASRTGNLVSMRTEDPDWRLELLIDLGE